MATKSIFEFADIPEGKRKLIIKNYELGQESWHVVSSEIDSKELLWKIFENLRSQLKFNIDSKETYLNCKKETFFTIIEKIQEKVDDKIKNLLDGEKRIKEIANSLNINLKFESRAVSSGSRETVFMKEKTLDELGLAINTEINSLLAEIGTNKKDRTRQLELWEKNTERINEFKIYWINRIDDYKYDLEVKGEQISLEKDESNFEEGSWRSRWLKEQTTLIDFEKQAKEKLQEAWKISAKPDKGELPVDYLTTKEIENLRTKVAADATTEKLDKAAQNAGHDGWSQLVNRANNFKKITSEGFIKLDIMKTNKDSEDKEIITPEELDIEKLKDYVSASKYMTLISTLWYDEPRGKNFSDMFEKIGREFCLLLGGLGHHSVDENGKIIRNSNWGERFNKIKSPDMSLIDQVEKNIQDLETYLTRLGLSNWDELETKLGQKIKENGEKTGQLAKLSDLSGDLGKLLTELAVAKKEITDWKDKISKSLGIPVDDLNKIDLKGKKLEDLQVAQTTIEAIGIKTKEDLTKIKNKNIFTLLGIEKKIAIKLGKKENEEWGPNWENKLEKKTTEINDKNELLNNCRDALEGAGIIVVGKSSDELKNAIENLQQAETNLKKIDDKLSLLKTEKNKEKILDEQKLNEYYEVPNKINDWNTAKSKISTAENNLGINDLNNVPNLKERSENQGKNLNEILKKADNFAILTSKINGLDVLDNDKIDNNKLKNYKEAQINLTNAENRITKKLSSKLPNNWKLTDAHCQDSLASQQELTDLTQEKDSYEKILKNVLKLVDNSGNLLKETEIRDKILGNADFSQIPTNSQTNQKATLTELITGYQVDATDWQNQLQQQQAANQQLQTQLNQARTEKDSAEKKEQTTLQFINQQIRLGLNSGVISQEAVVNKIKQLITQPSPRNQLTDLTNQLTNYQTQLTQYHNQFTLAKNKVRSQAEQTNNSDLVSQITATNDYLELVELQTQLVSQVKTQHTTAYRWNIFLATLSTISLLTLLGTLLKIKLGKKIENSKTTKFSKGK